MPNKKDRIKSIYVAKKDEPIWNWFRALAEGSRLSVSEQLMRMIIKAKNEEREQTNDSK